MLAFQPQSKQTIRGHFSTFGVHQNRHCGTLWHTVARRPIRPPKKLHSFAALSVPEPLRFKWSNLTECYERLVCAGEGARGDNGKEWGTQWPTHDARSDVERCRAVFFFNSSLFKEQRNVRVPLFEGESVVFRVHGGCSAKMISYTRWFFSGSNSNCMRRE